MSEEPVSKQAEFEAQQQANSDELDAVHRQNHPEMYEQGGHGQPKAKYRKGIHGK